MLRGVTGYYPINIKLYHQAFLHNSAVVHKNTERYSNERLEFLGDAVIDLVVAEFVFKKFPGKGEGYLTEMRSKIVSREQLSTIARKLGIEKLLTLNESLRKTKNTNLFGIAGNALEAFTGAIYLDHGFKIAQTFIITKLIRPYIDIENLDSIHENYKSILIQWGQRNKKIVDFRLIEEVLERNGRLFKMGVYIDDELVVDALHQTKKKAEQSVSEKAIAHLQVNIVEYKLFRINSSLLGREYPCQNKYHKPLYYLFSLSIERHNRAKPKLFYLHPVGF